MGNPLISCQRPSATSSHKFVPCNTFPTGGHQDSISDRHLKICDLWISKLQCLVEIQAFTLLDPYIMF